MMACDHTIDVLTVLATENGEFLVLQDGDTLILLYDDEEDMSDCTTAVFVPVDEGCAVCEG